MLCFATVFLCIELATSYAGSKNLNNLCQLPEPRCQFGQWAECIADDNGNHTWVCQTTFKKKSSSKHTSAKNAQGSGAPKYASEFWMNLVNYGSQGGNSPLTPENLAGSSGFGNVPAGDAARNSGFGNVPAGYAAGNSGFGNAAAAAQQSGAPKYASEFLVNSANIGSPAGNSPLTAENLDSSSGFGNVPARVAARNSGFGHVPAGYAAGNSGFGNAAAAAQQSGAPKYASEFWMNSANFGSPVGNSPLTVENPVGSSGFGNVPARDAARNSGFGNVPAGYAAGNSGFGKAAAAAQRSGAPKYASEFWMNSANFGSPAVNSPLTAENPAGNSGFGNVPTGFTAGNGGLGSVPPGLAAGNSGSGNVPAGFAAGNNRFGNASSGAGDTTGNTGIANSPAGYAGSNSGFDNASANNLAGKRSSNVFGNVPSAYGAGNSGLGNFQDYAAGNIGFGNRPTGYVANSNNGLRANRTGFTPNAGGLPGTSSNLDLAALQMALGAQPAAGAGNGKNGGLPPGFSSNSGESLGQLQEGAFQNPMPSFSFGAPQGANQPYSPISPNVYGSSPAVNGYPPSQPNGFNLGFSTRNRPMTLNSFDSPAGYYQFGQPPVVTGTFASSQPKIPLNDLRNVLRLQKAKVPEPTELKIRLSGADLLKTLGLLKRHGRLENFKFSGRSAGTGKAALISADIAAHLQRSARRRSEEISRSRKKD